MPMAISLALNKNMLTTSKDGKKEVPRIKKGM